MGKRSLTREQREEQWARNRQYAEWRDRKPKPKPIKRPRPSACGDVTITRPDGTVIVAPAYSKEELLRIAPERLSISDAMRQRIMRRDGGACRYCGKTDGPFHMDHVIPVAHGGPTNMRNLVTACDTCNLRKGTDHWKPNPLPRHKP